MKAPIGRYGGKSRLKEKLIEMFPKNYITFVEPFVGAGNIFYSTPKVETEVINDLDKDMYILHKGLQKNSKYINDNLDRKITKRKFEIAKNKNDVLSIIYKYKTSFNRLGKNFSNDMEGDEIKTDFTPYQERLAGVKIFNEDFKSVIKRYDSPKTFIYLDPPYEAAESGKYYKYFVSPKELYDALQGIKSKFMISYNDSANIRKIFGKYNIRKIKAKNKVGGYEIKEINELVITNY
jgi:DNA adenine methylase